MKKIILCALGIVTLAAQPNLFSASKAENIATMKKKLTDIKQKLSEAQEKYEKIKEERTQFFRNPKKMFDPEIVDPLTEKIARQVILINELEKDVYKSENAVRRAETSRSLTLAPKPFKDYKRLKELADIPQIEFLFDYQVGQKIKALEQQGEQKKEAAKT